MTDMLDSKTFKHNRRAARFGVLVACAVLFGALLTTTLAQQPSSETVQFGVRPARGVYVIRNARVVTVSGADMERATIVIQDGKIASVGVSVTVPAGAQEIDGNGLTVFPGMIDLGTAMGLVEIPSGAPGTVDTAETGDINPNAQAFYAINPHSAHIGVTRVNGITSVLSSPAGGLVSGQATFINLEGTTQPEMAIVPQAALVINFPRLSVAGISKATRLQTIEGTVPKLTDLPRGCHFSPRCPHVMPRCNEEPLPLYHLEQDVRVRCVLYDATTAAQTSAASQTSNAAQTQSSI